jgi:hypothetical protein
MIEILNGTTGNVLRGVYLKCLEEYSSTEGGTIIVNHFSEFTQDFISGITESIEDNLISNGDNQKVIRRIYSILIEGLQNIRSHAEKDEGGYKVAFLFMVRTKEFYTIKMGNLIRKIDEDLIHEYIGDLNMMDEGNLRKLYVEILYNSLISRRGGAGLGFLIMRMKSGRHLNYNLFELSNDQSFFIVDVRIAR